MTIPTSDYFADSVNGMPPYERVKLYPGSTYRVKDSDGKTPMTVTATWGYSDACPDDIFIAIIRFASWRYRSQSSGIAQASNTNAGVWCCRVRLSRRMYGGYWIIIVRCTDGLYRCN